MLTCRRLESFLGNRAIFGRARYRSTIVRKLRGRSLTTNYPAIERHCRRYPLDNLAVRLTHPTFV